MYRKFSVSSSSVGAFGYAALYCCNATLLTWSGLLPTGLMLMGLGYNAFLCFHQSVFRESTSASIPINAAKTLIQIACIWILALVVIPYVILDAFDSLTWPRSGFFLWTGVTLFVVFGLLGLASSFFSVRDGSGTPLPLDQTKYSLQPCGRSPRYGIVGLVVEFCCGVDSRTRT